MVPRRFLHFFIINGTYFQPTAENIHDDETLMHYKHFYNVTSENQCSNKEQKKRKKEGRNMKEEGEGKKRRGKGKEKKREERRGEETKLTRNPTM